MELGKTPGRHVTAIMLFQHHFHEHDAQLLLGPFRVKTVARFGGLINQGSEV